MLSLISLLVAGVLAGWLLRRHPLGWLSAVVTGLVWLLLFLLGIEAGGNPQVMAGLSTLGLEALALAVAGLLGSCVLSLLLWKAVNGGASSREGTGEKPDTLKALKGSIIIVAFFAVGCMIGVLGVVPEAVMDSGLSMYALYGLLFSVGMSVGNDSKTLGSLRLLKPGLAFLPIMTMAGTLGACALLGLVLPHRSTPDVLAVGSGFGYYSLSSVLISGYKGAELGTVALLANVFREIITLLGAPLILRVFGPLAPISCGGATTMDTTLPVITCCCGKEYVALSVFHGFVMDTSVPLWVSLFCGL